jgi:protein NrfD
MIEVNTTKLNPNVIPHLHVWGWEVPIYLFLGGLSAGLLIIASINLLTKKDALDSKTVRLASLLSPLVLSLGMVFLFLDLANKLNVWRFYTAFVPASPMSWGSWILVIFMPFSFAQALILYKEYSEKIPVIGGLIGKFENKLYLIAKVNVFLGVAVGAYTGILLSSLFARPLWNNSALGLVFLISGLSAAAALLLIIAPEKEKHLYSKYDFTFIVVEVFAIALLILGALNGTNNTSEAMMYLITGPYATLFWGVTIGLGVVVPLIFEGFEVIGKIRYLPIIPILVLIGSLSLRFIMVYAGQEVPTLS